MSRPQSIENRERILEAAQELMYRRGYRGVSMDDIADVLKVNKANIFHYYSSKESLGLAVFDFATRGFQEKWEKRLSREGDPAEIIGDVFDDIQTQMNGCGCSGGCMTGNLAQELSDSSEVFRQRVAQHFSAWSGLIYNFLESHRQRGALDKNFDTKNAAGSILCLLQGALLVAKASRDPAALDRAKIMAVAFLRTANVSQS